MSEEDVHFWGSESQWDPPMSSRLSCHQETRAGWLVCQFSRVCEVYRRCCRTRIV